VSRVAATGTSASVEWRNGTLGSMSGTSDGSPIRGATPDELDRLRETEREADKMFAEVGIGPFTSDGGEDQLAHAALVLVAGDPPVGFASVQILDGGAHLSLLAVLPSSGRHGIGTALVMAVCDWARSRLVDAVTLTTYRDVPWNAPFYERLGFRSVAELTPGLSQIREDERARGIDRFGPRVVMRKDL
jgi:GNAT superfamily N-acetyltransferase